MIRRLLPLASSLALLAACAPPPPRDALLTEAERSIFRRTGRYAEVERLCLAFEDAYPGRASCVTFGKTPEGRPMLAIVASDDGLLDPESARAAHRPVILVQGGIHAGEIDGKDGGLWAMRELLDGTLAKGALRAATAVFVPVLNVDGHERFGPNHRPNQRGPEEAGFRVTSQNLNLNRDYMKAEAPETQAILALFQAWDPVVYVDLHTTDGAKFQHDVAVLVEPRDPRGDGLETTARTLEAAVETRLTALGHLPLTFYPAFEKAEDPASGFSVGVPPPRLSNGYAPLRNRLGILVETHSWSTNDRRVRTMHDVLGALFERAITDAPAWRAAADAADAASARLAGASVALTYKNTAASRLIDFRGFAYEKRPSDISGGTWIVYDETRPEIWRVPLLHEITPDLRVSAPRAGYVVPAGFAAVVGQKLRAHGLRYEVIRAARRDLAVEAFRADAVTFDKPYEGRTRARIKGAWRNEHLDLQKGSLFVPIAQPRARLVMHLMEPLAPDSLAAWGYFNAVFEQKEYMEDYVAEEEARRMLAESPALRAEFEQRLAADPELEKSPEARLDFFYRRHPAWDRRMSLVPVFRVAESPIETAH
jgi:hypothetical protein